MRQTNIAGSSPSVEAGRRQNAIENLSRCKQSGQADQERGALAYRNGTSGARESMPTAVGQPKTDTLAGTPPAICRSSTLAVHRSSKPRMRVRLPSVAPIYDIMLEVVIMAARPFDYKSQQWRRVSAKAMRRDGYQCQLSRRYGKAVPAELVHHIYPVDEYPEYGYCLWNLISLSRAVHNTLHDRTTNQLTDKGLALMRRTRIPDDPTH